MKLRALAATLLLSACSSSPVQVTVVACQCPFEFAPAPLADVPGVYLIGKDDPCIVSLTVNGRSVPLEAGRVITGHAGDLVSACRTCGCSAPVLLR